MAGFVTAWTALLVVVALVRWAELGPRIVAHLLACVFRRIVRFPD